MYVLCNCLIVFHIQPEDDHYQAPKHVVVPYVENTLYYTNKYSCVRPVHTLYISLFRDISENEANITPWNFKPRVIKQPTVSFRCIDIFTWPKKIPGLGAAAYYWSVDVETAVWHGALCNRWRLRDCCAACYFHYQEDCIIFCWFDMFWKVFQPL